MDETLTSEPRPASISNEHRSPSKESEGESKRRLDPGSNPKASEKNVNKSFKTILLRSHREFKTTRKRPLNHGQRSIRLGPSFVATL